MLTLYRGDDYAGQLGKTLTIHLSLDAGLPIGGLKAVLEFYDIKKEFTPIQYENDFTIEVSHNQSKKYPLGVSYAKLYCVDAAGKIRTFCNRIPICVTTDLRKVYGSDGLDKQDVHVYALVHWDNIAGKPDYFPTTIEEVEGLEEALRQAGKVKTVNNIEPDENGNIHIDLPSCKVISVNGKEGVIVLNAGDIGYGDDSTVDTALAEAEENIKTNADKIDSLEQQVTEHIDNTYTKSEVDDKINQNAAHYLTKRTGTEGHYSYPQFATHADLAAAKAAHTEVNPQFFYGTEGHTPDKNDYCVVLADETHNGATTRYAFVGEWNDNGYFRYQYTINQTAFTEEQWAAINSLTSVDEDGNLCFDGIPFMNSSGELLFTEEDPIFTAWKNEVQIVLGSNASVASGKYKQIAIGAHAQANGQNAIALGSSEPGGKTNGPRAMAQNAIAIGAGANATAVNAIQLLAGTNNTSGTMQIGDKRVAFVSDIPISQADIDDYRYYKGHWDMSVTYKIGDIVRAERTVEGQTEKEVTYFKSLNDNNRANNPFSTPTYWSVTTDDEGLEKLTLFVKAAIAGMTGADIPVSPTDSEKIDVVLGKKLNKTIITVNGQCVFKNGTEEIITYSALLALVKAGGVVLLDTVAGTIAKEALFHPHMVDDTAIRFDATGTLGEKVYTRSFAFTPKADGGIAVSRGDLTEVAKKSDIPTSMPWNSVANKPSVFPPELVSDLNTRPITRGKAADARDVFDKLNKDFYTKSGEGAEFGWDNANRSPAIVSAEGFGTIFFEVGDGSNRVWSILHPDGTDVATLAKISGITAQDIIDFLHYKGEWSQGLSYGGLGGRGRGGDVVLYNNAFYEATSAMTSPNGFYVDEDWILIYAKNDGKTGLERLIDLFGESNSQMVATIEDKAVIFLRYSGDFIYKGEVADENKITKFSDLAKIVQTGRAVLQATATSASGSSPVLFRPHMINDGTGAQAANILFDATGTIDEGIYTRCIRATKKAGTTDELMVQGDNQRERLAKYNDLAYALVNVGADGVLTDRAINVTSASTVSLPSDYTDLIIRATVTDSLPVTVPDGVRKYGDAFPAESGEFLVTITKTGASEIYVRTLKIEEVA